eukprot:m.31955 g.31955  ORF g.31955 m.31955 type:complete len:291 (+) comp16561_c0_seq1:279-1151(+)
MANTATSTQPATGMGNAVIEAVLSSPNVVIISQQRGDPEPSQQDMKTTLSTTLAAKPAAFLRRWGNHVPAHLFSYFSSIEQTYELKFEIEKLKHIEKLPVIIRNRRLQHMKRLLAEGEYFSLDSMATRCPNLYHDYVGKYLTEQEIAAKTEANMNRSWSAQLMEVIMNQDERLRRHAEGFEWDEVDEEEEEKIKLQLQAKPDLDRFVPEEDSESEDDMNSTTTVPTLHPQSAIEDVKARSRGEFERMMKERFLDGLDANFFDYSTTDNDETLDDLKTVEQDAEDNYFDSD